MNKNTSGRYCFMTFTACITLALLLLQNNLTAHAAESLPGAAVFSVNAPDKAASTETFTWTLPDSTGRCTYREGFFYEPISDAVKTRINGISYGKDCIVPYEDLRYLNVAYVDFYGKTQTGELICNKAIAADLAEIFSQLYDASYPIERIRLIDEYGGDDTLSMTDNNTSCFNFRLVDGTKSLSKHAYGLAIDINPLYNPYVTWPGGKMRVSPAISRPYADRSQDFPNKIDKEDLCYKLFKSYGFTWGGDWKTMKDYQHFQKAID